MNDKETSRKQITMPLHRRGRKYFTTAPGTNAKQTQEDKLLYPKSWTLNRALILYLAI